jgi:hypothetical protein
MRTKTEYQEITDNNGKKKRVKIGLAPVQRAGLEYEFDLVGYMDDENNLIIDKTRCPDLSGKIYAKPGAKEFEPFVRWLDGAVRKVSADDMRVYLDLIENAENLPALKSAFEKGYRAAQAIEDKDAMASLTTAKDARKEILSKGKINPRGSEDADPRERDKHFLAIQKLLDADKEERDIARSLKDYVENNLRDEILYIAVSDQLAAEGVITKSGLRQYMDMAKEAA